MHVALQFSTRALLVVAAGVLVAGASTTVLAQGAGKAQAPKIPPPERQTVETKDGVTIHFVYYPATLGKKAVPVILLHGWGGQGADYDLLARRLQAAGHAAVTPDLRGHGRSKTFKTASGDSREIDPEKFRLREMESFVLDVEAVYRFLLDENNEGKVNIEALGVVGADFSTIVALKWAQYNWERPVLPAYKLGQDVKALVLLSPVAAFKGMTNRDALTHPIVRGRLSTFIAAGKEDSKAFNEAKRLHSALASFHQKFPDDEEDQSKIDLYFVHPDTKLQGTDLLGQGLPIFNNVLGFINLRLVMKMDEFEWLDRRTP